MNKHFNSFMKNRYGTDDLNYAILFVQIALIIVNFFFRSTTVTIVIWVLFFLFYFRVFSKNISARRKELLIFQKYYSRIKQTFVILKKNLFKKDNYYYAICRNCRQMVRLPKGKGKIEVTCPKCGYHFDTRT